MFYWTVPGLVLKLAQKICLILIFGIGKTEWFEVRKGGHFLISRTSLCLFPRRINDPRFSLEEVLELTWDGHGWLNNQKYSLGI